MNDSIEAQRGATSALVFLSLLSLSLSLSLILYIAIFIYLSRRWRENMHRMHIDSTTRTIASLLEAIRDESPPWRNVHGGNGVVGCGSYIPAEINSEQRGI